jgi:hypothetical protein
VEQESDEGMDITLRHASTLLKKSPFDKMRKFTAQFLFYSIRESEVWFVSLFTGMKRDEKLV